jgi:hypothetical protein
MEMRRFATIFILVLCSCEELIDSTTTSPPPLLIVEAIITNERINHRVKLTLPHSIQNAAPVPASGAVVTLTNGTQTVTLEEIPTNSGEYYTPMFRAVTGLHYTLTINYAGKLYTATDASIPVSPLQPLRYNQTPNGYLLIRSDADEMPTFTDHRIIWEHTPDCNNPGSCKARVVTYDLQNIDVQEIFKPEAEALRFPRNSIVIRKKYSASDAYRAYLRGMLSETKWRGGVFDVPRSNPLSNIHGDAAGFFAVSTVVSDTTIVK